MPLSRAELGDSHNFGRRVEQRGDRIWKPRALLWEWLVLSAESPLRRLLDRAAASAGLGRDAFRFLPNLRFFPAPSRRGAQSALLGGEVERVALAPLPRPSPNVRRELARIAGRSFALWSWLGVSDLHWENLVLGAGAAGRVVFAPLDVELILADLSLPTETKLLPDADPEYAALCQHACGARRLLPYLGKPIAAPDLLAMLAAYRDTLGVLDAQASAIADVFARLPGLGETPIRVILRSTGDYVRADREPLWPPLLDAEKAQLARGDVPYFFRLYGRRGIHYFRNAALTELERLPLTGDVPKLDPIHSIARGLRAPSRRRLRNEGLLTLLGAFDHPELTGRHRGEGLALSLGARAISLEFASGEALRSRRDLRAFVSSVYQPCRCGEVKSVFVPRVTRCAPRSRRSGPAPIRC